MSYGPRERVYNPARVCLGLDPESGESPKILFDDAGDGSRPGTANQAAARSADSLIYRLLAVARRDKVNSIRF